MQRSTVTIAEFDVEDEPVAVSYADEFNTARRDEELNELFSELRGYADRTPDKQLRLTGSMIYTAQTWDRMMRILAQGRMRFNDLITARMPLDGWEEAFRLCMDKEAIKVVIDPSS